METILGWQIEKVGDDHVRASVHDAALAANPRGIALHRLGEVSTASPVVPLEVVARVLELAQTARPALPGALSHDQGYTAIPVGPEPTEHVCLACGASGVRFPEHRATCPGAAPPDAVLAERLRREVPFDAITNQGPSHNYTALLHRAGAVDLLEPPWAQCSSLEVAYALQDAITAACGAIGVPHRATCPKPAPRWKVGALLAHTIHAGLHGCGKVTPGGHSFRSTWGDPPVMAPCPACGLENNAKRSECAGCGASMAPPATVEVDTALHKTGASSWRGERGWHLLIVDEFEGGATWQVVGRQGHEVIEKGTIHDGPDGDGATLALAKVVEVSRALVPQMPRWP